MSSALTLDHVGLCTRDLPAPGNPSTVDSALRMAPATSGRWSRMSSNEAPSTARICSMKVWNGFCEMSATVISKVALMTSVSQPAVSKMLAEVESMLQTLGFNTLDELIDQVVPEGIRVREPLNLAPPLSEEQALQSGMEVMSDEFKRVGGEIYIPITPAQ